MRDIARMQVAVDVLKRSVDRPHPDKTREQCQADLDEAKRVLALVQQELADSLAQ